MYKYTQAVLRKNKRYLDWLVFYTENTIQDVEQFEITPKIVAKYMLLALVSLAPTHYIC